MGKQRRLEELAAGKAARGRGATWSKKATRRAIGIFSLLPTRSDGHFLACRFHTVVVPLGTGGLWAGNRVHWPGQSEEGSKYVPLWPRRKTPPETSVLRAS
jgi:hypothetical protein